MGSGPICRRVAGMFGLLILLVSPRGHAADEPILFGVLNQRSVSLTAQFWNPILNHASRTSGVPLVLKMGRSAPETTEMTVRGEFGFVFTNHLFAPARDQLGYQAIARFDTSAIRAQIVVPEDSPLRSLDDLQDKTVVFPSREAFVGYWVPMDKLLRSRIRVHEVFANNQEAAILQLRSGTAVAAAVNANVLEAYAMREHFRYRVLWASEGYLDLPVMANPAMPAARIEAVRKALVTMADTPEGREALARSAQTLGQTSPLRFVAASNRDYDNYRRFYRETVVKAH